MQRCAIVVMALAIATAGCGKPAEQKQAEQAAQQVAQGAQQVAKSTEQGASQAAKGLEQMAKGLEAMANGAGGNTKPVDPVSFRDLQTVFPDLDGWEKAKPTGERMTSPVAYSEAEVHYTKGDSRLTLKIVDSGFNQLLLMPFTMLMQTGYEKETSSGYEKSTTVAGQPGWEKWNTEGKDGEVTAFVNKRFILTLQGRNVDDVKALHQIVGHLDLAKLGAMK
jgi:uncharacterized protein YceK